MSRGPYMKRPVTTCMKSSVNTASLTRWLAVTFCQRSTHANVLFWHFTWHDRDKKVLGQIWTQHIMFWWDWTDKVTGVWSLPWSWRESSFGSTSPWVWKEWIRTLLFRWAQVCWNFRASWPTRTHSNDSTSVSKRGQPVYRSHVTGGVIMMLTDLSQEKRHNIGGLPVWCVEEVR